MKNLITILLHLLFSFLTEIYSQNPGKCIKTIDEFTKDTIIQSDVESIGRCKHHGINYFIESKLYLVNGFPKIVLVPEFSKVQTIEKGEIIYFKFDNDSIFEFHAQESEVSDYKSGKPFTQGTSNTVWYNELHLPLSKDAIDILTQKQVVKIRIHGFVFDIKKGKEEAFKNMINCANLLLN